MMNAVVGGAIAIPLVFGMYALCSRLTAGTWRFWR